MVYGLKYRTLSTLTAWLPLLPAVLCSLVVSIVYNEYDHISTGNIHKIRPYILLRFYVVVHCFLWYTIGTMKEVYLFAKTQNK